MLNRYLKAIHPNLNRHLNFRITLSCTAAVSAARICGESKYISSLVVGGGEASGNRSDAGQKYTATGHWGKWNR